MDARTGLIYEAESAAALAKKLDAAEKAERELAEAREAIRDLTTVGDAMRFSLPPTAMCDKGRYDYIRRMPAVVAALAEREGK